MSASRVVRSALFVAVSVEWLKFRNALLPLLATIGIVAAVAILSPVTLASRGQGSAFASTTWTDYLGTAASTTASGGLFGFGIVIVWLFGREFADGTVTGLFALPVPRPTIAAAKLSLFGAWAWVTSAVLALALVVVGLMLGLGPLDSTALEALLRQFAVSLLTALLVVPIALVATLTRGYFAPIGAILGITVLASVIGSTAVGGWFLFAAPGLWASAAAALPGPATAAQLALVVPMAGGFATATLAAWRRLQV